MSINPGIKAFTVGTGGVTKGAVCKLSSGAVVLCTATATDNPVGIALYAAAAAETVAVALLNESGSREMIAAGAISAGAKVYAAADGKVQALPVASGTYRLIGIALEAATADGDLIEVLPYASTETATV